MTMSGLMAKGVPPQPKFLFFIKIAIIVLSVVILALAAWAISIFGSVSGYYGGYTGASGLLIFAVIKTWIIYGALLFIETKAQHLYWRIIAIIACIISIIFWLSAWAWSASLAAWWLTWTSDIYYYGSSKVSNPWRNEGAALAACAGLGAVVWVLSIVHLVFLIRACMHDAPAAHQAELGQVGKTEATSTVYPATQPTPVTYAQPGVYQEQPAYGQPAPYAQPAPYTQPAQAYPQ